MKTIALLLLIGLFYSCKPMLTETSQRTEAEWEHYTQSILAERDVWKQKALELERTSGIKH